MKGLAKLFGDAFESRNDGGGSECGHHGLNKCQFQPGIDWVLSFDKDLRGKRHKTS